jgi:uncharacterized protein (TIGR00266 family)
MKHEILYTPSFGMLAVTLSPGDSLKAEAGSMVAMEDGVSLGTSLGGTGGGFLASLTTFFMALLRRLFGGESFFVNTFTATREARVFLAPTMVGDLRALEVSPGSRLLIQSGSYLASTPGVTLRIRWGGLRSILGREGAFLLEASGAGTVFINSYGAIEELEVHGALVVDTGHLVAFTDSLNFRLRLAGGGLWTAFKSGEGLVFEFTGHGKLLLQTRNLPGLVRWIAPSLPV